MHRKLKDIVENTKLKNENYIPQHYKIIVVFVCLNYPFLYNVDK
jgi:hypothetical protein